MVCKVPRVALDGETLLCPIIYTYVNIPFLTESKTFVTRTYLSGHSSQQSLVAQW